MTDDPWTSDVITIDTVGPVRVVVLNRPDAMNAANRDLHRALAKVWLHIKGDLSARAVVLTGAGRAFSAGGDLGLLSQMVVDRELRREVLDEAAAIVRTMLGVEIPIVAAVNGPAVGLGCSLVSLCDLVVMSASTYLADPHVALGLVAGDGGALSWPALVGLVRAKEVILLGDRVSAKQALEIGLVNRIVLPEDVRAEAVCLAERLAGMPPQAVRATKGLLNRSFRRHILNSLDGAIAAEFDSFDSVELQASLARLIPK
jgi:enoyl-CoA hydratase